MQRRNRRSAGILPPYGAVLAAEVRVHEGKMPSLLAGGTPALRITERGNMSARSHNPWGVAAALLALLVLAGPVLAAGDAHGAETQGLQPGDLGQAIASLVIFLVLLVVLGKYAWKPLIAQMQRREQGMADALEQSHARQREAEQLLEDYRAQLARAEADAKDLIAKARAEAVAAREVLLTEAREEARKTSDTMRQDIEQAKREALAELYRTTADLAAEMAGRIVRKTLRPEDHRQLLTESLEEIRRRAAKGH